MVSPKTLKQISWDDGAVLELLPSVLASPMGPMEGPMDVLGGAALFELSEGKRRALIAARPVNLEHGRRLDVVGLVSTGDRLQAATVARALDDLAAQLGCDQLAMLTQRAHVVKQASKHGWHISGLVLIKGFHRVQQ
jgi:hypothetical protein